MKKNLHKYNNFILENIDNRSFVYVYLDPRKMDQYNYGEYHFDYEPLYVCVYSGRTIHDSIADYINYSNKEVTKTARTNSKEDIPYHIKKDYYIIYKDDKDSKFKNRENKIEEFLKSI